jgi:hypothetical protein
MIRGNNMSSKPRILFGALAAAFLAVQANAQSPKPVEQMVLKDIRDMRFCEFLLIFEDHVDIYNTSASPGCPEDVFSALDHAEIAKDHGAKMAQLNGPKFWIMDEQTLGLGEAKTFGGIEARYGATLPIAALGTGKGSDPYAPYVTQKSQIMKYYAGTDVYELVDQDGNAFVLNAYGDKVKDGDPANLSTQLSPADGWTFRVRTLDGELVVTQKIETPSKMVGDDFNQYYSSTAPAE